MVVAFYDAIGITERYLSSPSKDTPERRPRYGHQTLTKKGPKGNVTPIEEFESTVRAAIFSENGYSPYVARVSAYFGLFE